MGEPGRRGKTFHTRSMLDIHNTRVLWFKIMKSKFAEFHHLPHEYPLVAIYIILNNSFFSLSSYIPPKYFLIIWPQGYTHRCKNRFLPLPFSPPPPLRPSPAILSVTFSASGAWYKFLVPWSGVSTTCTYYTTVQFSMYPSYRWTSERDKSQ